MAAPPIAGGAVAYDLNLLIGHARAVEFIQKKLNGGHYTVVDQTGCILATRGVRPDGYCGTKMYSNAQLAEAETIRQNEGAERRAEFLRNQGYNLLVHRIAHFATHGVVIPMNETASHLCGQRACFNGQHIVSEAMNLNLDRKFCGGIIRCPHHQLRTVVDLCQHDPKCIKATPDTFSCCAMNNLDAHPSTASVASEAQDYIQQVHQQSPEDLPGSQYLGAPEPAENEGSQELGFPESDPLNMPSSPPAAAQYTSPGRHPNTAITISSSSAPVATSSTGPVPPRRRPAPSPEVETSDEVRPAARRRLNPPVPAAAAASSSSGSGQPVGSDDFVVPDGTQFIEYESDDDQSSNV